MSLDLLIPFGILIALAVFLIYSRSKFEKDIVTLYEEKFDTWKKNNEDTKKKEKQACKELVGLVYKEDYKVSIELFNKSVEQTLQRGKFTIKQKEENE